MRSLLVTVAPGVYRAQAGALIHWGRDERGFLLSRAPHTEKRKARLLAHQGTDRLQEMLICQGPDAEIPMHAHEAPESCVLIAGRMVVEFADGRRIEMRAGDFLRIPAGVEHRPRPLGPCILIEYILK